MTAVASRMVRALPLLIGGEDLSVRRAILVVMYRERCSVLDHAVVWCASADAGREDHWVLPDGCMDLLWLEGGLLVAGPDTAAHVTSWRPGESYVGLRFESGVGPHVLGLPAHEVRDQRVPLADVWPSGRVRRISEELATAVDPARVLETLAARRLADAGPADPVTAATFRLLRRGESVDRVADAVGLGVRQLHRRSWAAFGYGPKTLARILRLNRALDLGRAGSAAADAAVVAGYADQAHLARDARSLTGTTFTALVG